MIELGEFQLNLLGIFITALLLILLFFKKIDLISILALTSSFYNIILFNYKPLSFGFQIFFFFSILFILGSIPRLISEIRHKKNFIVLIPVSTFLFFCLISLIFAYFNKDDFFVIKPDDKLLEYTYQKYKFSTSNITQFLYILFFSSIFISAIFQKNIDLIKIFKFFILGLNFNFLAQIFEIIYFQFHKSIPPYLVNLSFSRETIQVLLLKNFSIYRFSGLLPAASLLGIYISLALFILLIFKDSFSKKFLIIESLILILSGFLGFSSTFLLGLLFVIFLFLKNKKIFFIPIFIIMLLALTYTAYRDTIKIRMERFVFGLNLFLKYPLLGVGIGSNFSSDLLSALLSTTGILGTLSFLSIFLFPSIQTIKLKNNHLSKLMFTNLFLLFFSLIIWHGLNINIFWLLLGCWYNSIKCLSSQL